MVNTRSEEADLYILTEYNTSAGEVIIIHHLSVDACPVSKFTESNLRVAVCTLCISTLCLNMACACVFTAGIFCRIHICSNFNTCACNPVLVDCHGRVKTETDEVLISTRTIIRFPVMLMTCTLVVIAQFACPLNIIYFFLEICNTYAESIELISELSSQLVNHSLVCSRYTALCHSACNHLSHLITGDFLITAVCTVAVTFDYAVSCQLSNSVISPMVCSNIFERICSSKACCACSRDSRSQSSCCEKLLHYKIPPKKYKYYYL